MRIKLGVAQFLSARYYATDRHREYLDAAEASPKRRLVSMPPAGWASLAALLSDAAFDRWGRGQPSKLTGERSRTRAAAHTIHRALAHLDAHPALFGFSVLGYSEARMCVWKHGDGDRVFSVVPQPNRSMYVLEPTFEADVAVVMERANASAHTRTACTTWKPRPWHEGDERYGLFPEPHHLGW